MRSAVQQYLKTKVTTTSQGEILLLLYEGAINFLQQAKAKMEERDYAAKGLLIGKASDIIHELNSSLNKERGGDIAENLHHLYIYCTSKLLTANLRMDTAMVDEVIGILCSLRDAYAQIISEGAEAPTPTMNVRSISDAPSRASAAVEAEAQSEDADAQTEGVDAPPVSTDSMRRRIAQTYGPSGR